MRGKRIVIAAALVAAALSAAAALALWRDPQRLLRAEFARQRIAAGLAQATVEVAGHRWVYAYDDRAPAHAPTVVMLHGFTGSKENWYPLARRLRGRYRLLVPDLPGWGASSRRDGADYGYHAQAERVAAFLARVARQPGRETVLLGHSMGGGIAALVAARHPERIDRVGLLAASGVRFKDNRFGIDVLAGRNPFAVHDRASLQRYLGILFHDASKAPAAPWPGDRIYIARRRADAAFEQAVLERIGRSNERFLPGDAASAIRQPTLLLWCRQDAVIDASALDLYAAKLPQAARVRLDGCGHMSLMERPDAVAAAVVALVEAPAAELPQSPVH